MDRDRGTLQERLSSCPSEADSMAAHGSSSLPPGNCVRERRQLVVGQGHDRKKRGGHPRRVGSLAGSNLRRVSHRESDVGTLRRRIKHCHRLCHAARLNRCDAGGDSTSRGRCALKSSRAALHTRHRDRCGSSLRLCSRLVHVAPRSNGNHERGRPIGSRSRPQPAAPAPGRQRVFACPGIAGGGGIGHP